jgi:hypothetical protein
MSKLVAILNPLISVTTKSSPRKVSVERLVARSAVRPVATRVSKGSMVRTRVMAGGLTMWVAAILLAANITVGLFYFFGVNTNVAKGFEIKKLNEKVARLSEESKKLVQRSAEAGSIAQMQQDLSNQKFVPVTTAEFALAANQITQAR